MTRPSAESFVRTVTNVAAYPVGIDTAFGLGSAFVLAWRPERTSATWVFTLAEEGPDFEVVHLGTVAVVPTPDESFGFDVIVGNGTVALATGFRSPEAAIGFALDEVCAPEWRTSQSAPDPLAV